MQSLLYFMLGGCFIFTLTGGVLATTLYAAGVVAAVIPRIKSHERRMTEEYSYTERIGIG